MKNACVQLTSSFSLSLGPQLTEWHHSLLRRWWWGVFLSLVTKSRKSSTLLSFSTSRGNHTLLPVCGYPWEMSRGFDTSNFLGSPSTQASPLQLHVMTSEGLLPAQRLYEETPRPHISRPLHLSEIMKEESTSSSPSLRSRLQSQ